MNLGLSTELKKLKSIKNIKIESVDTEHFLVPNFMQKIFFLKRNIGGWKNSIET